MKVEQPDSTGGTIESAQASGELACPLDGTSMQAHHIATRLGVEPFPRAGNVVEVASIENNLIENDVCHRTVAGASCRATIPRPLSSSEEQSDLRL